MIELEGKKYFTAKETAEKLNITLGRLAQLRREKAIKCIKVSERKFLFSEQSIKDYVLFSAFNN